MKSNEATKKYFYYYLYNNSLKEVSKETFNKGEYKIVMIKDNLVKLVVPKDYSKKFVVKNIRKHFSSEGLMDDFKTIKRAFKAFSIISKFVDRIESKDHVILLEIARIMNSIRLLFSKQFSIDAIIAILVDFYLFAKNVVFRSEALEEFCLAAMSMWLPPQFFEIFRRMSAITNVKVCDTTIFSRIVSCVMEALVFCVELLPKSDVTIRISEALKSLVMNNSHLIIEEMRQIICMKDISVRLLENQFRDRVKNIFERAQNNEFKEISKKSQSLNAIFMDFVKIYNRTRAYEESARVEPVCVVLEGKPGCGKSHLVNLLLESMDGTKYSHLTPDINGGKDFYDSYMNETIFYMDDVGQQGISQWRSFINMVSEVKYPLDCARAENKDTKFFNSELILATTNAFENLQGLTKQDCISDITALWRRCFVLDMSQLVFASGTFRGSVKWRSYDVSKNVFVDGFPLFLQRELRQYKRAPEYFNVDENDLPSERKIKLVAWMLSHINILLDIKKKRVSNNKLTESQISAIKEQAAVQFESQGLEEYLILGDEESSGNFSVLFDNLSNKQSMSDKFKEAFSWYGSMLKEIGSKLWQIVSDSISILKHNKIISGFCYGAMISLVIVALTDFIGPWFFKKLGFTLASEKQQFEAENELSTIFQIPSSTQTGKVLRHCKFLRLYQGEKMTSAVGIVSGHCIVTVAHTIAQDSGYVSIFNDCDNKQIIYDKIKYEIIYKNDREDVAIIKIPDTVSSAFKNLAHFFAYEEDRINRKAFLISPFGELLVGGSNQPYRGTSLVYDLVGTTRSNELVDFLSYNVRGTGLCGSPIVFNGHINGFHVAGNKAQGIGAAIRWSRETMEKINQILAKDNGIYLPYDVSPRIIEGSVLKFDASLPVSCGSSSNLIPTSIFNIYPITRKPANLKKFGKCTVKDVAKKSFGHTAYLKPEELDFGKAVMYRFFNGWRFRCLADTEIIQGTELLAGLNKKSSNGYKCLKKKDEYIDFENGVSKQFFLDEIAKFEQSLITNNPEWDRLVWCEALKDEMRNEEKEGVPRSFRVGTIHHQYLMKKYFGSMVEHIMKNRDNNDIMVGINPLIEWPKIYDKLSSSKLIFAGDIAKWDGAMNNMVQDSIAEVITECVPQQAKHIVKILLENATRSLVAVQDDLYLTTHSMPSGHYLTAILNSLVNRFYTAIWYYRNTPKPNVHLFLRDVYDFVYGDDKVVGINCENGKLNAITMREFFDSIGMGFTDASKNPIDKPAQRLDEITFLKRSFEYHNILKRIVPALDLRTLQSGLSYYDCIKDYNTVIRDKIHAYQREIYLHPNREFLLVDFVNRLKQYNVQFEILDIDYLYDLYIKPEEFPIEMFWGSLGEKI